MARDVGQSFLQNPIEVDGHIAVDSSAGSALLISYFDSVLFLKSREIDAECAFETGVVENHRMQRLRKSADVIERGLRDIADFAEIGAECRTLRGIFSGAIEQRADGREDLTELVV